VRCETSRTPRFFASNFQTRTLSSHLVIVLLFPKAMSVTTELLSSASPTCRKASATPFSPMSIEIRVRLVTKAAESATTPLSPNSFPRTDRSVNDVLRCSTLARKHAPSAPILFSPKCNKTKAPLFSSASANMVRNCAVRSMHTLHIGDSKTNFA
jgi:hypothetical protein